MKSNSLMPVDYPQRLAEALESGSRGKALVRLLDLTYVIIFGELLEFDSRGHNLEYSYSKLDLALFELFDPVDKIYSYSIDFEDYEAFFNQCLSLMQQAIEKNIEDEKQLEGYDDYMKAKEELFAKIVNDPKYEDKFSEWPPSSG